MDGTQQECIVLYTILGHGCLVEVIQKTHIIILMNKHTAHWSAKQCSSHSCSAGTMSQQDTSYIIIIPVKVNINKFCITTLTFDNVWYNPIYKPKRHLIVPIIHSSTIFFTICLPCKMTDNCQHICYGTMLMSADLLAKCHFLHESLLEG